MTTLAVTLTCPDATPPTRAHPTDAGLDLYATTTNHVRPGQLTMIHTGVAVAIPAGHVGILAIRSSLATKKSITLANGVGVIDADYRGEIQVPCITHDGTISLIRAGDRVAQLVICPIITPAVQVVDELPATARGTGGFGSTGA